MWTTPPPGLIFWLQGINCIEQFWLFVRIKVCSAVTKLSVRHSLLLGTALPHFQPSCLLDFFFKAYRMVTPSIHSCCATLHNFIHDLRLWCETKTAKWQQKVENRACRAKYICCQSFVGLKIITNNIKDNIYMNEILFLQMDWNLVKTKLCDIWTTHSKSKQPAHWKFLYKIPKEVFSQFFLCRWHNCLIKWKTLNDLEQDM